MRSVWESSHSFRSKDLPTGAFFFPLYIQDMQKSYTFEENNILQSVTLFKRKRTFAESGGRNRRTMYKKRFFLYPWFEVWKISSKRIGTMWRSLCLYIRMDSPCCIHLYKHTAWEYCFFVHPCKVFPDTWIRWTEQVSRFLFIITAWFWRPELGRERREHLMYLQPVIAQ